ncbi:MAG: NTP transferase domain-containing protein [Deltaproteobacteria bacterium]|nr:NTP transferase domain-containing protein [Deltaproteobacteria bacterium]
MVLCAGLGTRLRPLTEELPKPLVPVGDTTPLGHIAAALGAFGVHKMVVNTHHLPEAFAPCLGGLALRPALLHEPEILGTAGGVANAAPALGPGAVLVWNGDALVDLDLHGLRRAHFLAGAAATLAVVPREAGQGRVGLDSAGRIVRMRATSFGKEHAGADFVGVQILSPSLRAELPVQGCLVEHAYLPALAAGELLVAAPVVTSWSEIGTIESYLAANLIWLERAGRSCFVGKGASVSAGVRIEQSIVGAGARVEGSGLLRGCVVWPGGRAGAPLRDAVVTAAGRVVQAP